MAQPSVPYMWPSSGDGMFPDQKVLYPTGKISKPVPRLYVTEVVDLSVINFTTYSSEECMDKAEYEKDKKKCKNEKKNSLKNARRRKVHENVLVEKKKRSIRSH